MTDPSPSLDTLRRDLVEDAITSRRSGRAFRSTPVSRSTVERILRVARRAPSGTNMQPWYVHVMTGPALVRFGDALVDAYLNHGDEAFHEQRYYPQEFVEPYKSRRRKVGWDLYGLLGIARGEKDKMRAQHARNYRFFDAPVGMIFSIDRAMEVGSWLDFGMFLQNIMVAARGHGLHTCPQAAFAPYHAAIRRELGIGEERMIVCGMALGELDDGAIENTLVTERAELGEFACFLED